MFKTARLQQLSQVFKSEICFATILETLNLNENDLDAQLLHTAQQRICEPSHFTFIMQSAIQTLSYDIAYLFAPFILSNLNKETIYITPKTQPVIHILNQYFSTAEMKLAENTEILQDLNFFIQLSEIETQDILFLYQNLIQALLNVQVKNIFILSNMDIHLSQLEKLAQSLGIRISVIHLTHQNLAFFELDLRKLLFKYKDLQYVQLCADFSKMNAQILVPLINFTQDQATHLIDDMFYSEHIFEKLSVYSEYMTTRIFNAKQSIMV